MSVTIHCSLQVVIVGRNSLNNRFLPFSNIETEAVLALDDDQLVPFNQLELAFRFVYRVACSTYHETARGVW